MEDYIFEFVKKVCGSVVGLLFWFIVMVFFYGINKEVLFLKVWFYMKFIVFFGKVCKEFKNFDLFINLIKIRFNLNYKIKDGFFNNDILIE